MDEDRLSRQFLDAARQGDAARVGALLAAISGHVGVVRLLLDAGADLHAEDAAGWRPITIAAKGNTELVRLLDSWRRARTPH